MKVLYHNIPESAELETLARTYHCEYADLVNIVHYEKDVNADEHYSFFYLQHLDWYEGPELVEIVEYYPEPGKAFSYSISYDSGISCCQCQKVWENI